MPRLSVVMPAFNASRTLRAAALSTLRALPRDSELLIYDDASSDDTIEVATRLAGVDKRIRLVPGDGVNRGAAASRNILFAESDSEFVAAMDADDVTLPHRFMRFEHRLRDADLQFAPIIRFGRGRLPHVPRPAALSPQAMAVALFILNPVPQSTMIARRSVFPAGPAYVSGAAQDYELWLRLAASGARFRFGSWPTVAYRHHPAQATAEMTYTARVRKNTQLMSSWAALGAHLGVDNPLRSGRQQLRRQVADLISHVGGAADQTRLRRLLAMQWAFPLVEAGSGLEPERY